MFELKIQNQKMKQNHQSYEPPAKLQKTEDSDNSDSVTLNAPAENKDLDETLQTARVLEDTATLRDEKVVKQITSGDVSMHERRGEEPSDKKLEEIRQLIAEKDEIIEQLQSQIRKYPRITEKLETEIKNYSESMMRTEKHLATETEQLAMKRTENQELVSSLQLFKGRLDTLKQDYRTALAEVEQMEKQLEDAERANVERKEALESVQQVIDQEITEAVEEKLDEKKKEKKSMEEELKSSQEYNDEGEEESAADKEFDDFVWDD